MSAATARFNSAAPARPAAAPAVDAAEERRRREFRRNLKWMKIQNVVICALAGLAAGFALGELLKGLFS